MTNNEALKLIEAEYATTGFVGLFSPAFEYFAQTTVTDKSFVAAAKRGLERFNKKKERMVLTEKWKAAVEVVEQVNRQRHQILICDKEAA